MPNLPHSHFKNFPGERFTGSPNIGFGYLCHVCIRFAGEMINYCDFYSMQADSLHVCVPISVLNTFLTKMLVRQVGHVTIDMYSRSPLIDHLFHLLIGGNSTFCINLEQL